MDPIQRPDPHDPATSPFLVWGYAQAGYADQTVHVVWHKASDRFYHYTANGFIGCHEVSGQQLTDYLAAGSSYNLVRISSGKIALPLLGQFYPRRAHSHRLQRHAAARAINTRSQAAPWTMRHGIMVYSSGAWAKGRAALAGMAPLMKALATACRDSDHQAISAAAEDLRDFGGDLSDEALGRALVNAANSIADRENESDVLGFPDCGHVELAEDTRVDAHDRTYCQNCADDLIVLDGEYYRPEDLHYWESDGEYHLDEEEDENEGEDEDEDEDEGRSSRIVNWGVSASASYLDHDVSFTPNALGDFTLGVELEVECDDRYDFADSIEAAHVHLNANLRYAMFKRDGSLGDLGFEIVTAARRLDEHVAKFVSWTPHASLRAWNPGNCGVHVHIDSRAFSGLTLGKFLMFINDTKNKSFIKALAGRHPNDGGNAQSYCAATDQEHLSSPAKALKGGHSSRYRMVNLCNLSEREAERLGADTSRDCKGSYSTVELRIFRASLKRERLLAQIEFSHAAVMFCRVASWHALNGDAFKTWLAPMAGRYKHLARWYGINLPKANKVNPAPVLAAIDETC